MERIIIGIYSNSNIPPTLTDTEHHPTHLFSFSLLQNQLDVSGQKQSSIPAILRSHSTFFFFKSWFPALSPAAFPHFLQDPELCFPRVDGAGSGYRGTGRMRVPFRVRIS